MAENLGASFTIDTTDLKAGLARANKLIRESESEFKAAAAGMDDWQASQEGLNAQIKNLNTIADLQGKKVAALKDQYNRLITEGLDPASSQAIQLRTQINRETEAMNKNQRALAQTVEALENMDAAADDAADGTRRAADAAEDAADGFTIAKGAIAGFIANGLTAVAGAAKGAIGSLLGLADETAHFSTQMAKLDTTFATTADMADIARDTYADLYGILADTDKATEAAAFMVQLADNSEELAKWTNIATGVYATFGDALPIEALTEAASETAKTGTITGALADALNWAGLSEEAFQKSLDECNTEQERQSLIMETLNGQYDEASKLYQENNKDIIAANKAQAEFTATQAELGDKMRPISTALKQGFTDVLESILQLTEGVDVEAFTAKMESGFGWITDTLLPNIKSGVQWVANNIPTITTLIAGVTAAVAAQKVAMLAAKAATEGMTLAQYAAAAAQRVLNVVLAANPIGLIIVAITALVAAFVYLWNNCDAFREFWLKLWDTIREKFEKVWGVLGTFFTETIPNFFSNLVSTAREKGSEFLNSVVGFFRDLPTNAKKHLDTTVTNVITFGKNMANKGKEAAVNTYKKIVGELQKLPAKMKEIGGDIIDGIWDGIKGGWDWLTNKVSNLASSLLDAAKDALGIESPSKLFRDEVGKNIALGIGEGYEGAMGGVSKKISGGLAVLANTNASAAPARQQRGNDAPAAAGGKNVTVIQNNHYSQAHSRYELYKSKKETEAAVKLALLGV